MIRPSPVRKPPEPLPPSPSHSGARLRVRIDARCGKERNHVIPPEMGCLDSSRVYWLRDLFRTGPRGMVRAASPGALFDSQPTSAGVARAGIADRSIHAN